MNALKLLSLAVLAMALAGLPGHTRAQQMSGEQGQQDMMGPGNMGPGMMGRGGMGAGMGPGPGTGMGPGMGYGMGGYGQGGYGQGGYGMGGGMMGRGMMGQGMMGQGMMGRGMMGQGMMGQGMGGAMQGHRGGMMGPAWGYIQPSLNLSVADVKDYMSRWIEATGNPRLKLGKVTEKDDGTIIAQIVTKDDSLVQEFEVNRRTGFFRPAQ